MLVDAVAGVAAEAVVKLDVSRAQSVGVSIVNIEDRLTPKGLLSRRPTTRRYSPVA